MAERSGLRLLTRVECHLCDEAARLLSDLGLDYEVTDVDSSAELRDLYGEAVSVLFMGHDEIARAPIDAASLKRALERVGSPPRTGL